MRARRHGERRGGRALAALLRALLPALLRALLPATACAAIGAVAALPGRSLADEERAAQFRTQQFVANAPGTYSLPSIQTAGDGWVLERNGFPRRLSRYTRGAITLLSFVYTYCADPLGCPLAHAVFVDVRSRVLADPQLRGKVRFVSLSFDPTNDTPAAMRNYGAPFSNERGLPWHFLTTHSMRFLKPILDAYGQDVEVERDASGAPTRAISHLLKVFLIDTRGHVREIYGAAFLRPDVVFNDIRTLALENARVDDHAGTPTSAREAARPPPSPAVSRVAREIRVPLGLPPLRLPDDVVPDTERIELGRMLFFDRRLSSNGTMSCAMCHVPEQGFASNGSRRAIGIAGRSLPRNAPSLLGVAWRPALFRDGRESSLVEQAWQPLLHPHEMGNASVDEVLARIASLREYSGRFERAFDGAGASRRTVGEALAAFEASLVSAGSRFDRWRFGGDASALSAIERLGFEIFSGKAGCNSCHRVDERFASFTDGRYHVTGAGAGTQVPPRHVVTLAPGVQTELSDADLSSLRGDDAPDAGRFAVTHDPADLGAFRTPMLRDVARTAPYMHDGSIATLEEVVDFYDRGGGDVAGRSPLLRPLALSGDEKSALVAFLRTLNGENRFRRAAAAAG